MRSNTTIMLLNIKEIQNHIDGARVKAIDSMSKMLGEISQVGSHTYWASASANISLQYTVQINATMYKMQKYAAFYDNEGNLQVYEINNVAKGEASHLTKLNLKETKDDASELKELILNGFV